MFNKKSAALTLEDGTIFTGFSFGADGSVSGEVVFNTAMIGYPELLSDPLMRGHIVALTYPLIGNYGVPPVEELESGKVQVAGLVVTDYSEEFSHWNAGESLSKWLKDNNVPAIYGVDTRALAQHLRDHGEMSGKIIVEGAGNPREIDFSKLMAEVSVNEPVIYGDGDVTIAILDTGVQNSVIRSLLRRGVRVVRLPWHTDLDENQYDGLLLVGTADDPTPLAENVRRAIEKDKPIFGVRGADITLALAVGGKIKKLERSHRGTNQPVLETGTNHALITSQNHSWAIDPQSLPADWEVWFENLNDGSIEGIRRKTGFVKAVQFNPEPTLRPEEFSPLYDNFIDAARDGKK